MFLDYTLNNPNNTITKIYKGIIGRKFYIPAEYDVFVGFAPTSRKNNVISPSGKLRLRSEYVSLVKNSDINSTNVIILKRPYLA